MQPSDYLKYEAKFTKGGVLTICGLCAQGKTLGFDITKVKINDLKSRLDKLEKEKE